MPGRICRIVATTVTGLCALAGPVAAPALAAASTSAPTITLSTASVRPGVAFTASATDGCPEESGLQDVDFTYTDSTGATVSAGTTQTDDDGTWSDATLQLPVSGVDDNGDWQRSPVAAGSGTLTATCYASDDSGDDDPGAGDGDGDGEGDAVATQTYAPAALTAAGSAAALTLSATSLAPGSTVTVTPAEPCPSAADVEVDVFALSDDAETSESGYATTDEQGAWEGVAITLPDDAETGDYGVTADCMSGDDTLASYEGAGLGVGTLRISAPDCGGSTVTARLTGTFDGAVTGVTPVKGKARAVNVPAAVRFSGRGPWDVTLASAVTGAPLLTKTLTCPAADYELDVSRTGVADGKVRARVCNTGNAPAGAALQVRAGKRFTEVDDADLDAGDCSWLTGGRVAAGGSAAARVLLDAPGRGDDEVSATFTVRRHR